MLSRTASMFVLLVDQRVDALEVLLDELVAGFGDAFGLGPPRFFFFFFLKSLKVFLGSHDARIGDS